MLNTVSQKDQEKLYFRQSYWSTYTNTLNVPESQNFWPLKSQGFDLLDSPRFLSMDIYLWQEEAKDVNVSIFTGVKSVKQHWNIVHYLLSSSNLDRDVTEDYCQLKLLQLHLRQFCNLQWDNQVTWSQPNEKMTNRLDLFIKGTSVPTQGLFFSLSPNDVELFMRTVCPMV